VARAFVPDYRTISVPVAMTGGYGNRHPDEPATRVSVPSMLGISIAGPVIGMARAALDSTLATIARGKPVVNTVYENAANSPSVQNAVADAASLIDTATLHARRAATDIEDAAVRGVRLDIAARARIRMDSGSVMRRAREAVHLLLDVGGASTFAGSNPVQRMWRDIETASRHALVSPNLNREIYGRALLGVEETIVKIV
jgi:alkylation response protein AidB-like acyl-CoA dehydrogenase